MTVERGVNGVGAHGPLPSPATMFVRSLPDTLTVDEMIEKAKAHGHTVSVSQVHGMRGPLKLGFTNPDGTPSLHAKRNKMGLQPTPTALFVRALPETLTLDQMLEQALKAGHKTTRKRVDAVRRSSGLKFTMADGSLGGAKTKEKKVMKTTAAAALQIARANSKPKLLTDDLYSQVRRLALRYGSNRLREILDEIERE